VTVNNSTKQYLIAGTGKISGSSGIIKQGTAKLILATDNDFTGPVSIQGGTLQLGNGGAAGTVAGSVTIDVGLAATPSLQPHQQRHGSQRHPRHGHHRQGRLRQGYAHQAARPGRRIRLGDDQRQRRHADPERAGHRQFGQRRPVLGTNTWNVATGATLECAVQRITRSDQDTYNVSGTMLFTNAYNDFRNYIAKLNLNGGTMTGTSFAVGVGGIGSGTAYWNRSRQRHQHDQRRFLHGQEQLHALDVNVASGTADTALLWSGNIIDVDAYNPAWDGMTLSKSGDGKMVLTGTNAYKAASFDITPAPCRSATAARRARCSPVM